MYTSDTLTEYEVDTMSTIEQRDAGALTLTEEETKKRAARAQELIRTNTLISAGIGLIPMPLLDFAALVAQQIFMIEKLGSLYGQKVSNDRAKQIVLSLLAALLPGSTYLRFVGYSLLKAVPLVGPTLSLLTMPVLAGASTYAIGQVFNMHFASGGTFLSFDPVRHKHYLEEMMAAGKKFVSEERAKEEPHPEPQHHGG